MAIAKGDSLKSITLKDYFNSIKATAYAVKDKSIHFQGEGDVYLGYIIRSSKNQGTDIDMSQPVLLDGKHGMDWLGVQAEMTWVKPA
jgi:hypothetical protein